MGALTRISFQTPTEVALAYVRVFNRQDPTALRELYSDDFVAENPRWHGMLRNVDEVHREVTRVWATLPGARFEIENLVARGPVVVLELTFLWSDLRSGKGDDAHSADRSFSVTDVFWVVDGKLRALRAYLDSGTMASWLAEANERSSQ